MWITIDRENEVSLTRQIYNGIRERILTGVLKADERLPSTRELALQLSVSRNTVIEAYSQLIAEGYLVTRQGSGTLVAHGLNESTFLEGLTHGIDQVLIPASHPASLKKPTPAEYAHAEITPVKPASSKPEPIDFRTGIPALELFPAKEWGKLYREVCGTLPQDAFGYCGAQGVRQMREAIARYLFRFRGISCDPGRIIITSGSTQGLSLITHLFRNKGGTALMENPTHPGLRKVIATAGCEIKSIEADESGLNTDLLPRDVGEEEKMFIYTTPSHQYPLGGILPIKRRLDLIRWAKAKDCYIVEDDYDSEFRFEGQPVSSLYELHPEQVIYLGSFSKILAPALRMGFMVLPEKLLAPCRKLKLYADVHTDAFSQHTLAQYIDEGGFERHLWKMKKHYNRNRDHLIKELNQSFPGKINILGSASGLHLAAQFQGFRFSNTAVKKAFDQGVGIYPLGNFYREKRKEENDKIIMGYSHLAADEISKGISLIKHIVEEG